MPAAEKACICLILLGLLTFLLFQTFNSLVLKREEFAVQADPQTDQGPLTPEHRAPSDESVQGFDPLHAMEFAEPFTSTGGDQVLTTNSSGNWVSVDPTTNMVYCDGSSSCTQPYSLDSLKIGTWTIKEDSSGNLTWTKASNSSSAMRLSSSGIVKATHPAFSAYISSLYSHTASTSTSLVQFDTVEYDTTGGYSTSTYRYTPGVAGYYQVNWNVTCTSSTAEVYSALYKSGTFYLIGSNPPSSSGNSHWLAHPGSALVQMTSTDYLQIYFLSNNSVTVNTSLFTARFSAVLVSAT